MFPASSSNDFYGNEFFQLDEPDTTNPNSYQSHRKSSAFNFTKTKLCPFLLSGKCFKGSDCTFAHSEEELKKIPNLKKTRLCLCYQMGNCSNGVQCAFAHGEQELRQQPDFYKTALCIPFMSGKECKYGARCRFAHGYHELRSRPDDMPDHATAVNSSVLKTQSQLYSAEPSEKDLNPFKTTSNLNKGPKVSPYVQFESLEEKMKKNSMIMESPNWCSNSLRVSTTSTLSQGLTMLNDKQLGNQLRAQESGQLFQTSSKNSLLSQFYSFAHGK